VDKFAVDKYTVDDTTSRQYQVEIDHCMVAHNFSPNPNSSLAQSPSAVGLDLKIPITPLNSGSFTATPNPARWAPTTPKKPLHMLPDSSTESTNYPTFTASRTGNGLKH
jgi:hypothetical protein